MGLIIFIHLWIAWLLVSEGAVISKPGNHKVWVDKTVRLECCTDLDYPIIWFYTPVDSTKPREIFNGENIIGSGSNYAVDTTTARCYTLVIGTVASHHAGRYECQDNDGFGEKSSTELIVFENRLTCNNLDHNPCSMDVSIYGNSKPTSSNRCRMIPSVNETRVAFRCQICFSTGSTDVIDNETTLDLCFSRNITVDIPQSKRDDAMPSRSDTTLFNLYLSQESSNESPRHPQTLTRTTLHSVMVEKQDNSLISLVIVLTVSLVIAVVVIIGCFVCNAQHKKFDTCGIHTIFKKQHSSDIESGSMLNSDADQIKTTMLISK